MRAKSCVHGGEEGEDLRHRLWLRLLAGRQVVVAAQVTRWCWRHLPGRASAVRDCVGALDQAAMASGGKVTRVLAASVLDGLFAPEGEG